MVVPCRGPGPADRVPAMVSGRVSAPACFSRSGAGRHAAWVTRRAGALCAALLLVVVAPVSCASGRTSEAAGGVGTATSSAPTAPAVSVVLGGDSVMAGLVPAVQAALGDQAEVDYLAAPTISTASDRAAWRRGIERHDPDLVVVLVGAWEVLQPGFAPTEAGWTGTYAREVMDPLAASLTAGGARVLWIAMHAAVKPATTLSFVALAAQAQSLADRVDDVDVIDSGRFVDDHDGALADVLPGPDGTPQRIRRLDGTGVHLCPAGVVRLATPVLAWLVAHADEPLTLRPGWEVGPWRRPPQLPDPEQCPPAGSSPPSTS